MTSPHPSDPRLSDEDARLLDYAGLSAGERYAAFVEALARTGRFWVAESGEYLLTLFDQDGAELLPAWPSAATARASLAEAPGLGGYAPVARELAAWRERAISMDQAGVQLGVFPNAAMQCAASTAAALLAHVDAVIADGDESGDGERVDRAGDDAGPDLDAARQALAQKFAKPREQ